MIINDERKEVEIPPLSMKELAEIIEEVRSKPIYDDYKIVIKYGPDKNTIIDGELYLSD